MQSYRSRSHPNPLAVHSYGSNYPTNSSGSMSNIQHQNCTNDGERRRSHSRPPIRWEPPRRKSYPPAVGDRRTPYHQRENDPRVAGGRQGGGKVNRRRRHSTDTHHDRHPHRPQQQPRPRKNIVAPDESPASASQQKQSAAADEGIPKLDPSDPKHARRIQQRRRQVMFGKNTAGYEEYTKRVPRHKRRPRSLECPMTPDHTLDIPAKRWQGLMNAWRRSLHKYDPPDLHLRQPSQENITLAPRPCATEEDKAQEEIAQAKAAGLMVDFGSMNVGREAGMFSIGVADEDGANANDAAGKAEGVFFEEEAAYRNTIEGGAPGETSETEQMDGGFLEESDDDSDDDIL